MTNPPVVPSGSEPERPRFGEYSDQPPQYSQPQYSQPQHSQPQYSQPQYGQLQPPAQQQPQHPYPQQQLFESQTAPTRPAKGVGIVAFVVGLVVLVGSPIAAALIGNAVAPIVRLVYSSSGTIDPESLTSDQQAQFAAFGVGVTAFILIGSVLGLWALIQGIVAAARNRGRAFGVLAIVFAVLAPILALVLFYVTFFAASPDLLDIISTTSS